MYGCYIDALFPHASFTDVLSVGHTNVTDTHTHTHTYTYTHTPTLARAQTHDDDTHTNTHTYEDLRVVKVADVDDVCAQSVGACCSARH